MPTEKIPWTKLKRDMEHHFGVEDVLDCEHTVPLHAVGGFLRGWLEQFPAGLLCSGATEPLVPKLPPRAERRDVATQLDTIHGQRRSFSRLVLDSISLRIQLRNAMRLVGHLANSCLNISLNTVSMLCSAPLLLKREDISCDPVSGWEEHCCSSYNVSSSTFTSLMKQHASWVCAVEHMRSRSNASKSDSIQTDGSPRTPLRKVVEQLQQWYERWTSNFISKPAPPRKSNETEVKKERPFIYDPTEHKLYRNNYHAPQGAQRYQMFGATRRTSELPPIAPVRPLQNQRAAHQRSLWL